LSILLASQLSPCPYACVTVMSPLAPAPVQRPDLLQRAAAASRQAAGWRRENRSPPALHSRPGPPRETGRQTERQTTLQRQTALQRQAELHREAAIPEPHRQNPQLAVALRLSRRPRAARECVRALPPPGGSARDRSAARPRCRPSAGRLRSARRAAA
jgi:hypothetical protein